MGCYACWCSILTPHPSIRLEEGTGEGPGEGGETRGQRPLPRGKQTDSRTAAFIKVSLFALVALVALSSGSVLFDPSPATPRHTKGQASMSQPQANYEVQLAIDEEVWQHHHSPRAFLIDIYLLTPFSQQDDNHSEIGSVSLSLPTTHKRQSI